MTNTQKRWLALIIGIIILFFLLWSLPSDGETQEPTATKYVDWTAPYEDWNDPSSGPVVGYALMISTDSAEVVNWSVEDTIVVAFVPSYPGIKDSYTFIGLQINTTYYCAIKSVDEKPNWSGVSNIFRFETDDDAPPQTIVDLGD